MDNRFLFIGGDKRSLYAQKMLSEEFGCDRLGLGGVYPEPIGRYGRIVLPLPVSRDGLSVNAPFSEIPLPFSLVEKFAEEGATVFVGGKNAAVEELCARQELRLVDYFADESLTLKNAQLTAEAAASLLVQSTEGSLLGSRALVTGYGRCGKYAARLLAAFGAEVQVCARRPEQRTLAQLDGIGTVPPAALFDAAAKADFVLNTVPARLFSEKMLSEMKKGAVFMELATLPSEPMRELCEKHGLRYIHAAGLPGKYSPKTAGELIARTIKAAL